MVREFCNRVTDLEDLLVDDNNPSAADGVEDTHENPDADEAQVGPEEDNHESAITFKQPGSRPTSSAPSKAKPKSAKSKQEARARSNTHLNKPVVQHSTNYNIVPLSFFFP